MLMVLAIAGVVASTFGLVTGNLLLTGTGVGMSAASVWFAWRKGRRS